VECLRCRPCVQTPVLKKRKKKRKEKIMWRIELSKKVRWGWEMGIGRRKCKASRSKENEPLVFPGQQV
jgi:hypothetical protein